MSSRVVLDASAGPSPGQAVLIYASAGALIALVTYLLIVGRPILLPFVIALFVWYLINALATLSCRLTIAGRRMSGRLRFAVAVAALLLLSWIVVSLITRNVGEVMAKAPEYERNMLRLANQSAAYVGLGEVDDIRVLFQGMNLTSFLRGLTIGLTGVLGSLGTVAIYTVFLLLEQHHFNKKVAALFPDAGREALVRGVLRQIGSEIQAYVWLKTVISAATGLACYVVMKAVGLDLAEFWALIIFGLNFIPYIGPWLGVILPAFLSIVQFDSLTPFLVTTGTLSVIQFTGGSIIEPRLMGTGLNVSPVVMLLSLAVWGSIWGVVGMFLAVPMTVVLMIVCSHIAATRPIALLMSADGELRT
jgi:predicted PurR-regulated permease PerM